MKSVTASKDTVLVVDDEPRIVELTRLALEPQGYTVIGAFNGSDALELYADHHPDLAFAILDYMLPDMLGDELLERMMAIDGTVLCIAASGCCVDEIAESFLSGTATFIQKPFGVETLMEHIAEIAVTPVR
ncbi:MAG: response regulator [Armatimonadota bacterium]